MYIFFVSDEINNKKQLVHKTLKSDRNATGTKFKNAAKRLYKNLSIEEFEAEIRINEMIATNIIDEILVDKFNIIITDYYVDVPFEEDDIKEFIDFFESTIKDINKKCIELDRENPSDEKFPPIEINKSSEFFCNLLCGQDCKYFNEYKNSNKNSYRSRKKQEKIDEIEIEDLL